MFQIILFYELPKCEHMEGINGDLHERYHLQKLSATLSNDWTIGGNILTEKKLCFSTSNFNTVKCS